MNKQLLLTLINLYKNKCLAWSVVITIIHDRF